MFMHNGGIGGWRFIKRKVGMALRDEWYMFVQGGTDSEWAFALYLDTLESMGYHPLRDAGENGFGHTVLRKAMLKTIARINEFTSQIPEELKNEEDTRSLLNFAVSDGHAVICTRYVSSKTDEAASLFFSSGTDWTEFTHPDGSRDWKMERKDKGADIVLVASEPLTFERDSWVTVPTNSTLTIHRQTVMIHPIVDEFYNKNPSHLRSTQFAQTKGQTMTNEKKEVLGPTDGVGVDAEVLRSKVAALAVR
jgi:glutamine amidotransferase